MKYIQSFLPLLYNFGEETRPALFQAIHSYVDILDQVKQDLSFYESYQILSGDRPDNVSYELYGSPDYYWTFYLMNDHLRESGWPVAQEKVSDIVKVRYPHRTVTTKDDFTTGDFAFRVGQVVTGSVSGTVGTIVRRIPELGQMVIDTTNTVLDEQEQFTLSVSETGFATIEVDDSFRKTFHSSSLWTFYRDGVIMDDTIERSLDSLGKKATFQNIPFIENTTVTVVASLYVGNPKDNNFGDTESISYIDQTTGITIAVELFKESHQYEAVHHYEKTQYVAFDLDTVSNILVSSDRKTAARAVEAADNAELRIESEWVDIDPYTQNVPSNVTAVTVQDYYKQKNDELKQIKVLKADVVDRVAQRVYTKLREVT